MNSQQAKQIKLVDFLQVQNEKNEFFIKSPFNQNENTPSFKINQEKNIWYDHAQGVGGNIIDLVMQLNNCDFSSALKLLESSAVNTTFSFSPAKKETSKTSQKSELQIKKIQSLQNDALVDYLKKRKINTDIAKKYLKEIYYSQDNKNYFSLAFENDNNGYETRNPYFKGCIGSKDITTIKGTKNKELSIFEGFIDFLSALTHFKKEIFKSDVIILNSVSNKSKIEELLYSNQYSKIYLFLDSDKAGIETKQSFYAINNNCIDCSNIYQNYKDFNEYLITL